MAQGKERGEGEKREEGNLMNRGYERGRKRRETRKEEYVYGRKVEKRAKRNETEGRWKKGAQERKRKGRRT